MKSAGKTVLVIAIAGASLFIATDTNGVSANSHKTANIKVSTLIKKADDNKLKNGLYKTDATFVNEDKWAKTGNRTSTFIKGNGKTFKLLVTKKQLHNIKNNSKATITIKSKKVKNVTKLYAQKVHIDKVTTKTQTYSDVVIDENKLNSLAEKLQNGSTGDFIDEYTAMTMPEQSKYYRALVDKNLTVTIKGSAFNIDSQGNKMMVYAGNDIPGTNITQPISAEDYFQDKQKEHQIFRVETEGSQFLTVNPMDDVSVTGKLDQVANLYQKDKMDGYFKLTDATLMDH